MSVQTVATPQPNVKPVVRHSYKPVMHWYACLPRWLLHAPPVKHRHKTSERWRLDCFEFAILAAVVCVARSTLDAAIHRTALAQGKIRIERERRNPSNPKDDEGKKIHRSDAIEQAGRFGYRARRRLLRQKPPPDLIEISLTKCHLLNAASLSDSVGNVAKVAPTLNRLCRRVDRDHEPLLKGWKIEAERLIIQVNGKWLAPPFCRVPVPLPHTTTALALFLYLRVLDLWRLNTKVVALKDVAHRLGLRWHRPAYVYAKLQHAVAAVNAHIDCKVAP